MRARRGITWKGILLYVWKRARPWIPWLIVVALLYLLVKAVNPSALWAAAGHIQWAYCLPLAGAFFLYLALRALRWHLLMKPLRAPNSVLDSLLLFTAAQSAVLIPGGQFLLPVLQKSQHGTLIRRSAATILVQELIFTILLIPAALPDLPFYKNAGWFLLAAFLISFVAGFALLQEQVARFGVRVMGKLPLLRRFASHFDELRQHVAMVARTREAILGSAVDLASIAAMGTAFYIALIAVGASVGWVGALATFAFGASVGGISALPGGLGATEDISVLMLVRMGLDAGSAGVATLLFRAETLLLGTLAGWGALLIFRRRFRIHPSLRGLLEAIQKSEEEVATQEEPIIPDEGPLDEPAHEEELEKLEEELEEVEVEELEEQREHHPTS
ncbi:MAG TPA: lysylphosphatidylglycerol synthase transmembrane domain-containing protein [Ktedonobacterales bacterium]|nr:lysylphosphatidylglycerol synthase transmembrane domain-containing protein [Ktedonobacterales bacterium]